MQKYNGAEHDSGRIRSVMKGFFFCLMVIISADSANAQKSIALAHSESASQAFKNKEWDRAARLYELAYDAAKKSVGATDGLTAEFAYNVGVSLGNAGKDDDALSWYIKSYTIVRNATGKIEHNQAIMASLEMAKVFNRTNRYGEAVTYLEWGLKKAKLSEERRSEVPDFRSELVRAFKGLEQYDKALTLQRELIAAIAPSESKKMFDAKWDLASILSHSKNAAESESVYMELLGVAEEKTLPDRQQMGHLCYNIGGERKSQGNVAGAREAYEKARDNYERAGKESFSHLIDALNRLSKTYYDEKEYEAGDVHESEALKRVEAHHGADHPNVAEHLNDLGWSLRQRDQHAEAEEFFRRSVRILTAAKSDTDKSLIYPLESLGYILQELENREDDVIAVYQHLVRVQTASGDPLAIAKAAGSLVARLERGDPAQAEEFLTSTLRAQEKVHGEDSPELTSLLALIGSFYWRQGKHEDTERTFLRAVDNSEKDSTPDKRHLRKSLENLGEFYEVVAKYTDAETMVERNVRVVESVKAITPAEIALPLKQLSWVKYRLSKYLESVSLIERALAMIDLDAMNEDTQFSYRNVYANVLEEVKRLNDALAQFEKSRPYIDSKASVGEVSVFYHNYGLLFKQLGRFTEARDMLQKSLVANREELAADRSTKITDTLRIKANLVRGFCNLSTSQRKLGAFDESHELLSEALTLAEETFGPTHYYTMTPLWGLADHFSDQGNFEQAKSLKNRVTEIIREHSGELSLDWGWELYRQSSTAFSEDRNKDGERLFGEAERLIKRYSDNTSAEFSIAYYHGWQALNAGRIQESLTYFQNAIDGHRQLKSHELSYSADLLDSAVAHRLLGDFEKARQNLDVVSLAVDRSYAGVEYGRAVILPGIASFEAAKGNLTVAAENLREYESLIAKHEGKQGKRYVRCQEQSAELLELLGEYEAAEKAANFALEAYERIDGAEHSNTLGAKLLVASIKLRSGEEPTDAAAVEDIIARLSAIIGADHYRVANEKCILARTLLHQSKADEAVTVLEAACQSLLKQLGDKAPYYWMCQAWYGKALCLNDRKEEGMKVLESCKAYFSGKQFDAHPYATQVSEDLALFAQ